MLQESRRSAEDREDALLPSAEHSAQPDDDAPTTAPVKLEVATASAAKFELARRFGEEGPLHAHPGVTDSDHLYLHALAQQVQHGACTASCFAMADPVARAKWTAWESLGSMSSSEAMHKYIELVEEFAPWWTEWPALQQGSCVAGRPSDGLVDETMPAPPGGAPPDGEQQESEEQQASDEQQASEEQRREEFASQYREASPRPRGSARGGAAEGGAAEGRTPPVPPPSAATPSVPLAGPAAMLVPQLAALDAAEAALHPALAALAEQLPAELAGAAAHAAATRRLAEVQRRCAEVCRAAAECADAAVHRDHGLHSISATFTYDGGHFS